MATGQTLASQHTWREAVARYEFPNSTRSIWQLANTLIPFVTAFLLMCWSLSISYWLTLILAIPTALFYVRVFVLFHDCTHRSLFPSPTTNAVIGSLLGILTAMGYFHWRTGHARHHASAGNLDRRSSADVWTLTVQEYLASPLLKRWAYQVFRNPFTLFVIGPILKAAIWDRIPTEHGSRERWSVHGTNLALTLIILGAHFTIGLKAFLQVLLPPAMLATSIGSWLFYIQHCFEDTYWERRGQWNYAMAALHGSSFYKLPKALQWFTANIGYHHVHHLSPHIPNYKLQECHEENALFEGVPVLTLRESLKCLRYRLWDEDAKRLVGWDYIKIYKAKQAASLSRENKYDTR